MLSLCNHKFWFKCKCGMSVCSICGDEYKEDFKMSQLEYKKMAVCPFCKSFDFAIETSPGTFVTNGNPLAYWVECLNCHALGPQQKSKEAAIEKWNSSGGGVKDVLV